MWLLKLSGLWSLLANGVVHFRLHFFVLKELSLERHRSASKLSLETSWDYSGSGMFASFLVYLFFPLTGEVSDMCVPQRVTKVGETLLVRNRFFGLRFISVYTVCCQNRLGQKHQDHGVRTKAETLKNTAYCSAPQGWLTCCLIALSTTSPWVTPHTVVESSDINHQ